MDPYNSYTDEQLLALLPASDQQAFTVLFERYRNKLYYYLLKHTKCSEVAEEIVTDIFMKLWEGRELSGQIREFPGFIHKIGYYKAIDFLRTASRQHKLRQIYMNRAEGRSERRPDDILIDAETRALLSEAINQLPTQRKRIYQLSREEGLTHEQIASALNLSCSTVNNAITSATRSISQYLKRNLQGKVALSVFFFFG